jgi:hypothetical protein
MYDVAAKKPHGEMILELGGPCQGQRAGKTRSLAAGAFAVGDPLYTYRMGAVLIAERRRFVADHHHSMPNFCEPRHGHDWEVEAAVEGSGAEPLGRLLDGWAGGLDRSLLNDMEMLAGRNPTAEVLAECLFRHLEASGASPVLVRVREKPQYWAACSACGGSARPLLFR